MKKRKLLPRSVWTIADSKRNVFCVYPSKQEAIDDARGPRFRDGWTLIEYVLKASTRMDATLKKSKEKR